MAALVRQIAESRALLGDFLDLYQIHSATLESGVLQDQRVLTELNRLRESGLVIGLSVSGPRQAAVIRRALTVEADGVNPFQSVQATWNLLEPSAGPALAEAHAAGWGVIVKEALANGRLASRDVDVDPVGDRFQQHRAVGGPDDARPSHAARGRHGLDPRLDPQPVATERGPQIGELVLSDYPGLTAGEIRLFVEAERRRVRQRGVQNPPQIHLVRGMTQPVDVGRQHLDLVEKGHRFGTVPDRPAAGVGFPAWGMQTRLSAARLRWMRSRRHRRARRRRSGSSTGRRSPAQSRSCSACGW